MTEWDSISSLVSMLEIEGSTTCAIFTAKEDDNHVSISSMAFGRKPVAEAFMVTAQKRKERTPHDQDT